jgi:primosomal protein N' (replication factor Y)
LTGKERNIVGIAVALPVREVYKYSVPDHLAPMAEVGRRALVPFRNRKVIGYIIKKEIDPKEEGIKDILEFLDPGPLFNDNLVPFFQWMADYYLFPIGLLIQSALPAGINVTPFKTGQLTNEGIALIKSRHISSDERKVLSWINNNPGKRLTAPGEILSRMESRGWVFIEDRPIRRSVGPLRRKFVRLKGTDYSQSILMGDTVPLKAANEAEFIKLLSSSEGISLREIYGRFKNGPYLVKKWIKTGLIESYSENVFRDPAGKIISPSPEPSFLYDQQEEVMKSIRNCLEKRTFSTCLLDGVTGSGKTEVYFQAVKHALQLGGRAILMVPEIALAVYTEGIFRSRLGERVAVFHSGLSRGERYDQWMRILRGVVDIVIGARSALFAPLPGLSLIIVDEEHDPSYKQEDGPRYQARDAAVVRGRMEKALVILGSGTPSVQSFQNTKMGRYRLLSMPERIEKRPLPDVVVVDMKRVSEGGKSDQILSPILKRSLEENLLEGKQAILFLNRRGFSRVYLCRSCGESIRCRNCDLALTYHLKENNLVCHYCGFYSGTQDRCSKCGYKGMRAYGFGTERLEMELGNIFPSANIARLDRDSTRRKGETFNILKRFSDREIDVLVGTQMITKGYDFPHVTLVGVVSADLSLGFPDFRAGERTLQLLSQVAGRAGRGDTKGKVIIQTFNPEHYAITTAKNHDYISFFEKERDLREQLGYPPFSYLACLRFQGNDQKATMESAHGIGAEIRSILKRWPKKGKDITVLGPAEAPLAKLKNKHRWQILIKSKGTELLHYLLKEVEGLSRNRLRKSCVSMIIDVDPYQML